MVVSFWITQHTVVSRLDTETNYSGSTTLPVACPLVGYWRTVTLRLAAPLGHRPLIDSRNDAPVRVTRAPHH